MNEFIKFAESLGLIITSVVAGRWVRVPTVDHPKKRNGAYFYDGDYAHVQNWATMDRAVTWFADKPMTHYEKEKQLKRIEVSKKNYFDEKIKAQAQAAQKAKWIISQSIVEQHAYLDSKGFPEAVGLVWRPDEKQNLLIIPMRYKNEIVGCQMIDRDGGKKFLKGQRTIGAEFVLGSKGGDIWCEGYATGLSIRKCMKGQYKIHICFSAGNLRNMATSGFVVADNDESFAGEKAAIDTGLEYYTPPIVGHDFNDFHKIVGDFKAGQALKSAFYENISN